ncbi:MAG: hypothetical protein QM645_00830 [Asticcacaulis sp.]
MSSFKKIVSLGVALTLMSGTCVAHAETVSAEDVAPAAEAAESEIAEPEIAEEEGLTLYVVALMTMIAASYGDWEWSRENLQETVDDEVFKTWPDKDKYRVYYYQALTETKLEAYKKADEYLAKAAAISPESRDAGYWWLVANVAGTLGRKLEAVDAITLYVESRPDDLNEGSAIYLMSFVTMAGEADDLNRKRRLLEALRAGDYRSADTSYPEEAFWLQLFEIYADEGNDEKAAALLPFSHPYNIQNIRTDNRYRRFAEAHPEHFDYQTAVDGYLARRTVLVGEEPRSMRSVYLLSTALYEAGQMDEALAVVETILEKVGEDAYDDEAMILQWVYDEKGAIYRLRPDGFAEAEAAYVMARDLAVATQGDDIGPGINLANFYVSEDRPEDALKILKTVPAKRMSTYGKMASEGVRACAYAQLGQKGKLRSSLKYIRKNHEEAVRVTLRALTCAADEDVLAQYVIEGLHNKDLRQTMLKYVQTYLPEPYLNPMALRMRATRQNVLNREDVRKAIETYGIIEQIPYLY